MPHLDSRFLLGLLRALIEADPDNDTGIVAFNRKYLPPDDTTRSPILTVGFDGDLILLGVEEVK